MKRIVLRFYFIFIFLLNMVLNVSAINFNMDVNFDVNSDAVYMVNADSGIVVYEKNADKRLYPASLVKIMTAILALENVPDFENTMVTVPSYIYDEFVGKSVTHADIRRGEVVSMKDLFYALLIQSANEAANAIAHYISGGNISGFVDMMNEKAKGLGANDTNFTNANGLPDDSLYTTAKDMYIVTKHALTFSLFQDAVSTKKYEMQPTNIHPNPRYIYQSNLLIDDTRGGEYYYPYAKGVKTGSADQYGSSLVSMASKDGYNYILVTLMAPMRDQNGNRLAKNLSFIDAKNFYNWAFKNYKLKKIVSSEESVAEVRVKLSSESGHVLLSPSNDISYLLPDQLDTSVVQKIIDVPKYIKAPVSKGQIIGSMKLILKDEVLGETLLVANADIKNNIVFTIFDIIIQILTSAWFIGFVVLILVLFFIYIFVFWKRNVYKKGILFKDKRRKK